jgi:hypothetical protein
LTWQKTGPKAQKLPFLEREKPDFCQKLQIIAQFLHFFVKKFAQFKKKQYLCIAKVNKVRATG